MSSQLHISIIQTGIAWENIAANLVHFDALLATAAAADIYVLPEMFTTGFSMKPEKLAKESYEQGRNWMLQTARAKNAAIAGSLMAEEEGKYVNRLLFVLPNGTIYIYDKKHLFSPGLENQHYTAGKNILLIDYLGWKICPLICYDLRFPVWSRNVHNYDVLLYVANWPAKRAHHWSTLLPARAIENQCYVAACNRTGEDFNGLTHTGNSMLVQYDGIILQQSDKEQDIITATFDKNALQEYRQKFPFLADRDSFTL